MGGVPPRPWRRLGSRRRPGRQATCGGGGGSRRAAPSAADTCSGAALHQVLTHAGEITLLLTRGFGVQSINTSFDADFASRQAQAECARLLEYEGAELHTSNHYYMDIVQELRKEILQAEDGEQVWKKRPFLAELTFQNLKKEKRLLKSTWD